MKVTLNNLELVNSGLGDLLFSGYSKKPASNKSLYTKLLKVFAGSKVTTLKKHFAYTTEEINDIKKAIKQFPNDILKLIVTPENDAHIDAYFKFSLGTTQQAIGRYQNLQGGVLKGRLQGNQNQQITIGNQNQQITIGNQQITLNSGTAIQWGNSAQQMSTVLNKVDSIDLENSEITINGVVFDLLIESDEDNADSFLGTISDSVSGDTVALFVFTTELTNVDIIRNNILDESVFTQIIADPNIIDVYGYDVEPEYDDVDDAEYDDAVDSTESNIVITDNSWSVTEGVIDGIGFKFDHVNGKLLELSDADGKVIYANTRVRKAYAETYTKERITQIENEINVYMITNFASNVPNVQQVLAIINK